MSVRLRCLPPLVAALLLAGCVVVPTAPAVMALPGSAKSFDAFRDDDIYCRQYAQYSLGPVPGQPAADVATANAVGGAALGAAAGAIIGSASGRAGPGAAIGAGTGLLLGSAYGANAFGYSSYQLQRAYDTAYVQCMYARGNQVPAGPRYAPRPYYYGPPPGPSYGAPPSG